MCSLRDSIEVILTSFYKKQFTQKRVVPPFLKHSDISNDVYGLGDTVVLTPFIGIKRVSSEAPSFPTLVKYNKNSPARTGESNSNKWNDCYKSSNRHTSSPFGDTETYSKGNAFLINCNTVEDWGCGLGWFRKICTANKYIGIDGSDTAHLDVKADLTKYISKCEGIFMRHILEHNFQWKCILENACKSFTKRMVLVLFTPLVEKTTTICMNSIKVPDISFCKKDITDIFDKHDINYYIETIEKSATQYNIEHIFYLNKKVYSGFSKDNNRKYDPVVNIAEYAKYDWGGGHAIQRITRALGLPEKDKPQGVLDRVKHIPVAGRIGYHLSGNQDIHSITLETLRIFDSYKENHQEYEWHNLSSFFPLGKLIDFLSTCEYFIGINSGPMHLAAALGVKSIIIVNSPSPELLYLPKIKETEIPNLEWLYPQNVHLHTAGSNELVPFFSEDSLGDSLNEKSYPYFKDDFLDIGRKYYERI